MWEKSHTKTMRYLHMWRYHILSCEDIDDFTDIKFVLHIVLKFVGVSSKHLRVFLESLRQSSTIFGHLRKFSEIFGNIRVAFGRILENLRKSLESGRKSSENHQKHRHQYIYIVKRTLHVSSKIWTFCSRGKNNISRVSAANEWDIVLATRT